MFCNKCKKEIDDSVNFCPFCGYEIKSENSKTYDINSSENKIIKNYINENNDLWLTILIVVVCMIVIFGTFFKVKLNTNKRLSFNKQNIATYSTVTKTQKSINVLNSPKYESLENCKIYYDNIWNIIHKKQENEEFYINNYYNICGYSAIKPKDEIMFFYYTAISDNYKKKYDYNSAITYLNKYIYTSTNKGAKESLEKELGELYFYKGDMLKAKVHMLNYINSSFYNDVKKDFALSSEYELLGDICYNLEEYDESKHYWNLALEQNEILRQQIVPKYNDEKFKSIANKSFDEVKERLYNKLNNMGLETQ